jgi:hypothetical protein
MEPGSRGGANTPEGGATPLPAAGILRKRRRGEGMATEQATSKQLTRFFTEDWLAVVVGLVLVALVLTGLLKSIP